METTMQGSAQEREWRASRPRRRPALHASTDDETGGQTKRRSEGVGDDERRCDRTRGEAKNHTTKRIQWEKQDEGRAAK